MKEIHDIVSSLRSLRNEILDEWMQRRRINASKEGVTLRSRKAWMDHLPAILDQLFELLSLNDEDRKKFGQAHGKNRLRQGFDLAEAILDLNLLEEIVHDRVGEHLRSTESSLSAEAVHRVNREVSGFLNRCVVESAYTYLRKEDQSRQTRELHLKRRIDSLGSRLKENLEIVGASTHDLKGSNEVLVRLAEHALKQNGNGTKSSASALLEALSRGLLYNQQILEDLSILSIDRNPGQAEEVDAEEVIRMIGIRCALAFGDPSSRIHWRSTEKLSLYLNRLSLERILSNLIENAFSHGSDSPVILSWSLIENDPAQWRFEIENELPEPISLEQEKINAWVEEPNFIEMGLGLSVVTNLLEKMGGEIRFRMPSDRKIHICVRMPLRMKETSDANDRIPAAL